MAKKFLIQKIDISDVMRFIYEPKKFIDDVNTYTGTSAKSARSFLDTNFNIDEKQCLDNIYFSNQGWYKNIFGDESIKLKLIAFYLQMTHDNFTYNVGKNDLFYSVASELTQNEIDLLMSVYLKQKIITKKNLINNSSDKNKSEQITLFRGIKEIKDYKYSNNLESWTDNEEIAIRFSQGGYILKRKVSFDDILVYRKSAYKWEINPNSVNQSFIIRREHEYIVENIEKKYKIIMGDNCFSVDDYNQK